MNKFLRPLSIALISAAGVAIAALPAFSQLQVGSLREIEGDTTCGRGTGGILAYAETARHIVYICSDPSDRTQPRFYRSRSRDGRNSLNLAATNYNPRQMRYFEFRNGEYSYLLQIPTSQIPNPVLSIVFPDGRTVEEPVTRYLARQ